MKDFCVIVLLVILSSMFHSCYKEELVFNGEANRNLELPTILRLNGKDCCYDNIGNRLRYPIDSNVINDFSPFVEFQEYSNVFFEGKTINNKAINNFGRIEVNKEYAVIIETNNKTKKILLTFTSLPIVQIITPSRIFDEPKTIGKIKINYTERNKFTDKYFIGLEYRGSTSQNYQKKSYGFSLKGSINFDDDISKSLFKMKNNNDWILDAMWIDKARLRNKTSFEIWKRMDGEKHFGIRSEFIELYINNEHQGLYCLNENINSEYLNIFNANSVLYKATRWGDGATRFEIYTNNSPFNYYWDGWVQKYPNPKIEINWKPLDELIHLVVNENDEVFTSQITSFIDIDNFVDYYVFLNLVSALDNTGKNTFLFKENIEEKFHIIPWDLDGALGVAWDGTSIGYTSILSNNLFDRLIETNTDNFENKLKQRWSILRENIFSDVELQQMCNNNFGLIKKSGIIEIENKKWDSSIDIYSEQEYLIDWLRNRVIFLDNYFDNL